MMSAVESALQAIMNIGGIPRRFQGDIAETMFDDYFDVLIYAEVLYILLVFVGPKVMEKRPAMKLKTFMAVWNLSLSLFSCAGTIALFTLLCYLMETRGFRRTTCEFDKNIIYDGEPAFWLYYFLLSKIPEMMDTVFLVLQKKPVIFLHWYHHLTVTIFCWYAGHSLIPSGIWFATMNFAVHSVMYFYYFMGNVGLRKVVRPIAPFITGAQLAQMVVGTVIVCFTFYWAYFTEEGCNVDKRTIRMGIAMYGSYFALFAILFAQLYLGNESKLARERAMEKKKLKEAEKRVSA